MKQRVVESKALELEHHTGPAMQANEKHLSDQMLALMNEPFVERTKDFFYGTLEKIKNDQQKKVEFLDLCRTLDTLDEGDYEDPLKKIFDLVNGIEPLTQIFIELLPPKFTQRIFPKIEQNIAQRFPQEVIATTPMDVSDQFIEIVLMHHKGQTSVQQFKEQLTVLFRPYQALYEQLPMFFKEISDEADLPQTDGAQNGAQSNMVGANAVQLQEHPNQAAYGAQATTPSEQVAKTTHSKPQKKAGGAQEEGKTQTQAIQKGVTENAQENGAGDVKPTLQHVNSADKDVAGDPATIQNQNQAAVAHQANAELVKETGAAAKRNVAGAGAAKAQATPIPACLQKFLKTEVSFFLDQVPEMLKERELFLEFSKLFSLYLEGVLTQNEFSDLAVDLVNPDCSEQFRDVIKLVAMRDNSRREALDLGQCKQANMLTKSYYIFSDEYVQPICSGRYRNGKFMLHVLNDRYSIKTSGTEDYKFKIKNVHEDNLFKNEDEMYAIDHQILQFVRVIEKLKMEMEEVMQWSERSSGYDYDFKILSKQNLLFIIQFYKEKAEQPLTLKMIQKTIAKYPDTLIKLWIRRLEDHLAELREDKSEKIADWKQLCESNFLKSLDHRSFFFKNKQKDLLPVKKQQAELERIVSQPISKKSLNQLKGGSSSAHEYFCTYTSFKITNVQVYKDSDLEAPSLLNDYPINLRDDQLIRKHAEAMPHMRFLLNNSKMLELTFVILACGPRVGNNITAAEKQKIEEVVEILLTKFFKCEHSLKHLKTVGKQIQQLQEHEIALLTKNPVDYYRAKVKDGVKFTSWGEENSSNQAGEDISQLLRLPQKPADDCQMDVDSVAAGGKQNNSYSCSQSSSSDSFENSRQINAADMKQIITLKRESHQIEQERERAEKSRQMGLLQPAFKEGYSLLFGSLQFYFVFKTIASIYERLVMAHHLITEKVKLDLKRVDIREIIGINDDKELSKFADEAVQERFKLFVCALVGTLSQTPQRKLDPSNYEDIVRTLMGDNAYLLFVFDKLIMHTLKNLPVLRSSDECQKNLQLFQTFAKSQANQSASQPTQSEHLYLTQYQHKMQSVNNFSGSSIRVLYSPLSGVLCIHFFSLSPFAGLSGPSGGGQNGGHGLQTIASFRQLDSHKSKQLKANLYGNTGKRKRNNQNQLQSAQQPNLSFNSQEAKNSDVENAGKATGADGNVQTRNELAGESLEAEEDQLRAPVFLYRNRRKMKQIRKHLIAVNKSCGDNNKEKQSSAEDQEGEFVFDNGLVLRQVPMIRKLYFDSNTTDYMAYKRPKFDAKLHAENLAKADYIKSVKFEQIINEQRKKQQVASDSLNSEERIVSDEVEFQLVDNKLLRASSPKALSTQAKEVAPKLGRDDSSGENRGNEVKASAHSSPQPQSEGTLTKKETERQGDLKDEVKKEEVQSPDAAVQTKKEASQ